MRKKNNPYLRIFVIGGIFLILFFVVVLLPPKLVNQPAVKKSIIDLVSRKTGARFYYRNAELSFFPRPRAVIHDGHVSQGGMIRGNLKTLTIYLKILPLFSGDVEIAELRLETPDFDVKLSPRPSKEKESGRPAPRAIENTAGSWPSALTAMVPAPAVSISNGRLTLTQKERPTVRFQDIRADVEFSEKRIRADITCGTGFSKKIDLKAWIDPKNRTGSGVVDLAGLRPRLLADWLLSDVPWGVGDSLLDLKFTFNIPAPGELRGKLEGALSRLTLLREGRSVEVKGNRLAGNIHLKDHLSTFTLEELKLETPRLDVTGTLALDRTPSPRTSEAPPRIQLEVTGWNVDVDSARKASLALLGDIPTARGIFDIVKGGPAPRVTYKTQGNTWEEAGEFENMFLDGGLRTGRLSVPVDFDLEAVSGDLIISNGVMEATNLAARWNSVEVLGGTFRWDINDATDPFHLELKAKSDVADLPSILKRFVEDESFLRELARLQDIRGKAVGSVILGERLHALDLQVDVSDFSLSARHPLAPYPLEIRDGRFAYSKNSIDVKGVKGRFGNSSFSGIVGGLDWKETPRFEIPSGEIRLSAGEYDAWLASFETFREDLKQLTALGGEILLTDPRLKGELFNVQSWEYQILGEFRNLVVESPRAPAPLNLIHGNVEMARRTGHGKRTFFRNVAVSMMDAELTVTGSLVGKPDALETADLAFEGEMGPETIKWLSDAAELPPEFIPRSPLSISRGRLAWEETAGLSFGGDLAVKDGPVLSLDLLHAPDALGIRKLSIRHKESNAAMTVAVENGETALTFQGALAADAMDALLENNDWPRGAVEGDFRLRIPHDQPMQMTATGALEGKNLTFPGGRLAPLKINAISIRADKSDFTVDGADLAWKNLPLIVSGDLTPSPGGVEIDMDVFTRRLILDDVKEMLEEDDKGKTDGGTTSSSEEKTSPWDVRFHGDVRLTSDAIEYDDFTWAPFEADIRFSRDKEVHAEIKRADLCGISFPGIIETSPDGEISLAMLPNAEKQDLSAAFHCFLDEKMKMSGHFGLEGRLEGRGNGRELAESLKGDIKLKAEKGRIDRFGLLSRILALLNLTEVFIGNDPDLAEKGFAYNTITVNGAFDNGKFVFYEGFIDAPAMGVACQGEIDYMQKKVDVQILLAPFKTMDRVFGKIPVASDITGGSIISIPVRVRGDLFDPKVIPLDPAAVGRGLLGALQRTISLPVKLIKPVFKRKGEKPPAGGVTSNPESPK